MKFTTFVVLSLISLASVSTAAPLSEVYEAETSLVERDIEVDFEDSGIIARDFEDGFEEDLELRGGAATKIAKVGAENTWTNGAQKVVDAVNEANGRSKPRGPGVQPTITKLRNGKRDFEEDLEEELARRGGSMSNIAGIVRAAHGKTNSRGSGVQPTITRLRNSRRNFEDDLEDELARRAGVMSKIAKNGDSGYKSRGSSRNSKRFFEDDLEEELARRGGAATKIAKVGAENTWTNGAQKVVDAVNEANGRTKPRGPGVQPTITKIRNGKRDFEDDLEEELARRGGAATKIAKVGAENTWTNGAQKVVDAVNEANGRSKPRGPGVQPTITKIRNGKRSYDDIEEELELRSFEFSRDYYY